MPQSAMVRHHHARTLPWSRGFSAGTRLPPLTLRWHRRSRPRSRRRDRAVRAETRQRSFFGTITVAWGSYVMGPFRGQCALIFVALCLAAVAARAEEPQFADFLARANAQAAAGHYWEPVGDNAMDTFRVMAGRLSDASPAQLAEFDALLTTMLRAETGAAATPNAKSSDGPRGADPDQATTSVPAQAATQDSQTAPQVRSDASVLLRAPTTGNQDPIDSDTGATEAGALGSSQITALLQQADQQIAAGRAYRPFGDNALGSLESVLSLLPNATPAEAKAFRDLPAHFRTRAQEAAAAGNAEQAGDYRQIADAIGRSAAVAATLSNTALSNTASAPTDGMARRGGSDPAGNSLALSPETTRGPEDPVGDPVGHPDKVRPASPRGQSTTDGPRLRPSVSPIAGNFTQPSPNSSSFVIRPSADARCRSLVQRMQIGEDLPDDDRAYLRRGCP